MFIQDVLSNRALLYTIQKERFLPHWFVLLRQIIKYQFLRKIRQPEIYRKIKVPHFLRVPKCYPRFSRTFLPYYVSSAYAYPIRMLNGDVLSTVSRAMS